MEFGQEHTYMTLPFKVMLQHKLHQFASIEFAENKNPFSRSPQKPSSIFSVATRQWFRSLHCISQACSTFYSWPDQISSFREEYLCKDSAMLWCHFHRLRSPHPHFLSCKRSQCQNQSFAQYQMIYCLPVVVIELELIFWMGKAVWAVLRAGYCAIIIIFYPTNLKQDIKIPKNGDIGYFYAITWFPLSERRSEVRFPCAGDAYGLILAL